MNPIGVDIVNNKVIMTVNNNFGGHSKTLSIDEAVDLTETLNKAINTASAYRPNPLKVCQDRAIDVSKRFRDVANSFGVASGPIETANATKEAARALEAYAQALKDLHR